MLALAILYGPVPGIGVNPIARKGVPGGTGGRGRLARSGRKDGSGVRRWTVTVPDESSVTIPCERSQWPARAVLHALAPTMSVK